MPKRIHELAKEWGVAPKDMLARAEKLGIRGKRSQSSLTDEEAERLKEDLGLAPRPTVPLGTERVVSERVVTERDSGADQLVTAREQTTETRLRANVIRRRTAREVLKREELPPAPPEGDGASEVPPSLDFEARVPPPPSPATPEPPAEAAPGAEEAPAHTPHEAEPAESVRAQRVAEAPPPAPPPAARPAAPAPPAAARPAVPVAPAPGFEEMRGVKVLGKIDLRKTPPPAAAPAGRSGEAAPGTEAAPAEGAPKKKKGRKVIKKSDMLDTLERDFMRGGKRPQKRRALPGKEQRRTEITVPRASKRVIRISEVVSVADVAKAMGVKASEVLKKLLDMGMMATINQMLDHDTAALVAGEFEYQVENVAFDVEQALEAEQEAGTAAEGRSTRAPVVTMMGHVDHGKTSLLDAIRSTDVAAGEAGGITQHIGAYTVDVGGRQVTFLDTPGHEAFTAMRARGAKVTDLVVLVVAADDGVMPQTVEAINHARAANVPIVVAVNKVDKPEADPERVKRELANHALVPEEWGGQTIYVPTSAKKGTGIDQLLEMTALQSEILELKANPTRAAKGVIIESRLDRGRGPVATVLIQNGTLKEGDAVVVGAHSGRIRALIDPSGKKVKSAGPSDPVEIQGLSGVPSAGDVLVAVSDERKARQIATMGQDREKAKGKASTRITLEGLQKQIQTGEVKELRLILKADVQGSVEALAEALERLSTDEVKLKVIHSSVGAINESDVMLASASNAVVIGFNVKPEAKAVTQAQANGVDVRTYNVIYEAINDLRAALAGMLAPEIRETALGRAQVRQIFVISKLGPICGSYVAEGKIVRGARARVRRGDEVVGQGTVGSLKRFKDDVREVLAGLECGIGVDGVNGVQPGDILEVYTSEEVARTL